MRRQFWLVGVVAVIVLVGVILLAAGTLALAQGGEDDTCPALVDIALAEVGTACADLGRDEACYGHFRVDAEFFQARDDLAFSAPADSVPLADLRTIHTAPLDVTAQQWGVAVLNLQANLPETLPGQAVRFLLMGDVTLENRVEPSAAERVAVGAVTTTGANLRSQPSTATNVVTSLAAGANLTLTGVTAAGDWYRVALAEGGTAWVWGELVSAADAAALAALPVVDPADLSPDYGPMQAVYFSSGLAEPGCHEMPNGLLVENTTGTQVALNINGLEMQVGSSILFQTVEVKGQRYLHGMLLEGEVDFQLGVWRYRMNVPGNYFAITLNDEGWVDLDSRLEVLRSEAGVEFALREACLAAGRMVSWMTGKWEPAIHGDVPVSGENPWLDDVCESDLYYLTEEDTTGSLCRVTANQLTNKREGPGTEFDNAGTLGAGQMLMGEGQAIGSDNIRWWLLDDNTWIRSDMVTVSPGCDQLPPVAAPTPMPPPTPDPNAPTQQIPSIVDVTYWRYTGGAFPIPVPANTPFIVWGATAARTEDLAANSYNYYSMTLTVDGVSYGESSSRRYDHTGDAECPISVHGSWTVPGLPPGQHTLSVIFNWFQHWPDCHLDRDESEGANPGGSWVDTCTITVR